MMRLARPSAGGSQVLEGDTVIQEVRLTSRKYSADMVLTLGPDAVSSAFDRFAQPGITRGGDIGYGSARCQPASRFVPSGSPGRMAWLLLHNS